MRLFFYQKTIFKIQHEECKLTFNKPFFTAISPVM